MRRKIGGEEINAKVAFLVFVMATLEITLETLETFWPKKTVRRKRSIWR